MPTSRQQKRLEVQRQIIKHFDEKIPQFTDIFDEGTFYVFFVCIIVLAIIAVVVLSNYCRVELKDADELRKQRERKERKRKEKLALKLLNDKLKNAKVGSAEHTDLKKKLEILQRKIKEAESRKAMTRSFIDDTDYEFSDDEYDEDGEHHEANLSQRTSTTTLKSD